MSALSSTSTPPCGTALTRQPRCTTPDCCQRGNAKCMEAISPCAPELCMGSPSPPIGPADPHLHFQPPTLPPSQCLCDHREAGMVKEAESVLKWCRESCGWKRNAHGRVHAKRSGAPFVCKQGGRAPVSSKTSRQIAYDLLTRQTGDHPK